MRSRLVVVLLAMAPAVGVAVAAPAPDRKARAEEDAKRLEGVWTRKVSVGIPCTVGFAGEEVFVGTRTADEPALRSWGGVDYEGFTYELDPTKRPRRIDLVGTVGKYKGKVCRGIYELQGERLRIRWADPGQERPTGFGPEEGAGLPFHRPGGR